MGKSDKGKTRINGTQRREEMHTQIDERKKGRGRNEEKEKIGKLRERKEEREIKN